MATPFAQVIARDTFTRANSGTLGANWTNASGATDSAVFGISSNAAILSPLSTRGASFWTANTFSNDQWSQVLVNSSGSPLRLGGVCLRATAGDNLYLCTFNFGAPTGGAQIAKVVAGVFTSIGTGNFSLGTDPQLIYAQIVGTTISLYLNGTLVMTATDSQFSSGSPGIYGYCIATTTFTNWQGGDFLWTREGTVIPVGVGGGTQEPSVMYEGNPHILSPNGDGKIWKMWHTNGWLNPVHINYAESNDGVTWTEYSSNPVISDGSNNTAHGYVMKNGSTYYAFMGNDLGSDNGTSTQIDLWTSSDGLSWSLSTRAVIATVAATWESIEVANPLVWVQGPTWYMLYSGRSGTNFSTGLATASSPSGPWTKYGGNPVVTNGTGNAVNGKNITLNGNLYYLWGGTSPQGSNIPTDISMWTSPDLHTWTACTKNPFYIRVTSDEGANLAGGQVADPSPVELNGTTWMYYDAIDVQASGHIHINAATAPYTILQLLGMITGNTIIAGNVGIAGATVSYSGAASGSVTADSSGNYVIPILTNGAYTITPSKPGSSFNPASQNQTASGTDITGVNFTSSATAFDILYGSKLYVSRVLSGL